MELKAMLEAQPKVVAHYPVEVRFARADDILLSPCFQRDSCYVNIIMYRPYGKDVPRLDYWLAYETIMKKVGGRPHWAKVGFAVRATPPRPSFPLHSRPSSPVTVIPSELSGSSSSFIYLILVETL